MFVSFTKHQNKILTEGDYYATVVDIDEVLDDKNTIASLNIKFASSEGYIVKCYDFNHNGFQQLYDDFIENYFINAKEPTTIADYLFSEQVNLNANSQGFDTHKDILGKEYSISIKVINGSPYAERIEESSIDYMMTQDYIIPYVDEIEEINEKMKEQEEKDSWANYHNSKSFTDDDCFGGLRGEEADTLYWNIQ